MENYPRSLQSFLDGISIAEDQGTEKGIWRESVFTQENDPRIARLTVLGYLNNDVAVVYKITSNMPDALSHLRSAIAIGEAIKNYGQLSMTCMALATGFWDWGQTDSSQFYAEIGLKYADKANFQKYRGDLLATIGNIYLKKGNIGVSKKYFSEAIETARNQNNLVEVGATLLDMSQLFVISGNTDSALWYNRESLKTLIASNDPAGVRDAYLGLVTVYKARHNLDSAFKYQTLAMQAD